MRERKWLPKRNPAAAVTLTLCRGKSCVRAGLPSANVLYNPHLTSPGLEENGGFKTKKQRSILPASLPGALQMRQESIYLSRALFLMRTLKNNTNKRCIHQYWCWCSVRGCGHRSGGGPRAAPHAPPTLGLEKGHVPIRKQQREREGQRYLTSRWQPARGPWAACSLGRRTAPLCWSFPERFPVQDIAMQTPPPQPLPAPQPYLRAGGCCRAHEMLMLEMRPGQHLSLPPSPWPRVMGGGWGRRGLKLLLGESLTAVGAAVLGCHRFFSPHHIASFSSLLFPHKPKKMVSQQPPPATCFPHLLQHRAGPGGEALPWGSSLGTAMLQGCTLLLGAWLQGWCMNAEECVRAHA